MADFIAGVVTDRDRDPRRRELLTEVRRVRIELVREVIEHEALQVASDRHLREHEEVDACVLSVREERQLAIALRATLPGELGGDPGEEGKFVGNDSRITDAFRRQCQWIDTETVAIVDILVLFLLVLVLGRRIGLDDVVAVDRARRRVLRQRNRRACARPAGRLEIEERVAAIEHCRTNLVVVAQAVIALAIERECRASHVSGTVGSVTVMKRVGRIAGAVRGLIVVPAVAVDDADRIAGVVSPRATDRTTDRIALPIFQPLRAAVGPTERIVVDVGELDSRDAIHVRDVSGRVAAIQIHLHTRNAGLPGLRRGVTRIVLGARRRVLNHTRNATVLAGDIGLLAPLEHRARAEEHVHALGQHRTHFGARAITIAAVRGILWLQTDLAPPDRAAVDGSATVHRDRHAGRLVARKINFVDEPAEEREVFVERQVALGVGRR